MDASARLDGLDGLDDTQGAIGVGIESSSIVMQEEMEHTHGIVDATTVRRRVHRQPSNTIMFDETEAAYSDLSDMYQCVDMATDAFCLGWLNAEVWKHGKVFASALTGQTVKIATEISLDSVGLLCVPAFCMGNFIFALIGRSILCKKEKTHGETILRRVLFKSLLELIYIIVTIAINMNTETIGFFVVVMALAAGITNGFHSRNLGQATAFMTGRVATIGTELGLYIRGDGSYDRSKFLRNVSVYIFFLLGGIATRLTSVVALAWPFHVKFALEMGCLLVLHLTHQHFPEVLYVDSSAGRAER